MFLLNTFYENTNNTQNILAIGVIFNKGQKL